jgi:hypothetical protein
MCSGVYTTQINTDQLFPLRCGNDRNLEHPAIALTTFEQELEPHQGTSTAM